MKRLFFIGFLIPVLLAVASCSSGSAGPFAYVTNERDGTITVIVPSRSLVT